MSRFPDPARRQLWQERLDRFGHSCLTVAQFCQQEGVSAPSFYQWKRKLAGSMNSQAPSFVPISVSRPVDAGAKLTLPGGATIDLGEHVHEDRLRQILGAVIAVTEPVDAS